jgi:hypothetical protein
LGDACRRLGLLSEEALDGRNNLGGGQKCGGVVPVFESEKAAIYPLGEGAYGRKRRVLRAGNREERRPQRHECRRRIGPVVGDARLQGADVVGKQAPARLATERNALSLEQRQPALDALCHREPIGRHVLGEGMSAHDDEPAHPLGQAQRRGQGDQTAHGESDEIGCG